MTVQRRTVLGLLGDVGFPEYDGAVVYRQGGHVYMDYVDRYDGSDEDRAAVGTVNVPSKDSWRSEWWAKDLAAIARTNGQTVSELEDGLDSKDPVDRAAILYYAVKGHSGLGGEEQMIRGKSLPRLFRWATTSRRRKKR